MQGRDKYERCVLHFEVQLYQRTSSSRALRSPSVGPFDPRAAGSLLIIPSTSLTIFTTVSTDAVPVEESATTEPVEGAAAEPSPATAPLARHLPVPSAGTGEDKNSGGSWTGPRGGGGILCPLDERCAE